MAKITYRVTTCSCYLISFLWQYEFGLEAQVNCLAELDKCFYVSRLVHILDENSESCSLSKFAIY